MILATQFTEDLRYEGYNLTPDSIVIDAGGYQGRFAEEIVKRYNCRVYSFEPVFYRHCTSTDKILFFPVGLWSKTMLTDFAIKGDMTGKWADGPSVHVVLVNVVEVLKAFPQIDLLKLNIEGAEYEVLDAILNAGLQTSIKNIQVQFHALSDEMGARYESIRARLLETHELTYDFPFCWQNFRLK